MGLRRFKWQHESAWIIVVSPHGRGFCFLHCHSAFVVNDRQHRPVHNLLRPQTHNPTHTHTHVDKLVINRLWLWQPGISRLTASTVNKSFEDRTLKVSGLELIALGWVPLSFSSFSKQLPPFCGGRMNFVVSCLKFVKELVDSSTGWLFILYSTNKCLKALAHQSNTQGCFSFISPRIPLSLRHTPPICWE